MTDEKVLKKIDELYEVMAQTHQRSPGMNRIEQLIPMAQKLVAEHPGNRILAATAPYLAGKQKPKIM